MSVSIFGLILLLSNVGAPSSNLAAQQAIRGNDMQPRQDQISDALWDRRVDLVRRYLIQGADPNTGRSRSGPPALFEAHKDQVAAAMLLLVGANPWGISVDGVTAPELANGGLGGGYGTPEQKAAFINLIILAREVTRRPDYFDDVRSREARVREREARLHAWGTTPNKDLSEDVWARLTQSNDRAPSIPTLSVREGPLIPPTAFPDDGSIYDPRILSRLVQRGDDPGVRGLLLAGVDPSARSRALGQPVLFDADRHPKIAAVLLMAGADPWAVNMLGQTAVMYAIAQLPVEPGGGGVAESDVAAFLDLVVLAREIARPPLDLDKLRKKELRLAETSNSRSRLMEEVLARIRRSHERIRRRASSTGGG